MPNVLHDFCAEIKLGKVTAIASESGSGKSTLAKLLLRLIEPDSGQIAFQGTSFNQIAPMLWRKKCGAVFQDGQIFLGVVAGNIALQTENPNTEQLHKACKIAGILDFISGLPNGFKTN